MHAYLLLLVLSLHTSNGVTIKTEQLGPFISKDVCTQVGKQTTTDLTSSYYGQGNSTYHQGRQEDACFKASFTCIDKAAGIKTK